MPTVTEEKDRSEIIVLQEIPVFEMISKSESGTAVHKLNKYDPKAKSQATSPFIMLLFVAALVAIGYFVAGKGLLNSEDAFLPTTLAVPKDRATNYNVRVLPASLNDEELSSLSKESFSYLAMIDAGSSGCRAHVYRYGKLGTITGPLYILPQHVSKKIKPGLSSFAKNPHDAGPSLQQLVDFVKEQVPEAFQATTPIWLKATAGLRMVASNERDAILSSVRQFLGNKEHSPFIFRSSYASVISGSEEGGFGWIAYNYLKKIIGPKATALGTAPYAVVEMGGASTQVTQVARTPEEVAQIPNNYRFDFTIEGEKFVLYTHSYLGFGAEAARESLNKYFIANTKHHDISPIAEPGSSGIKIKDTCLNAGYVRAEKEVRKNTYAGPDGLYTVTGAATSGNACLASLQTLFQPVDTISDKCICCHVSMSKSIGNVACRLCIDL